MAIYGPAPGLKGRTFELWVLNEWVFNFCICSTPLWKVSKGTEELDQGVGVGERRRQLNHQADSQDRGQELAWTESSCPTSMPLPVL